MRAQGRVLAIVALTVLVAMLGAVPQVAANHEGEGNPGPNDAHALYDPQTGHIEIWANAVARVSLFSDAGNILHPLNIGPGGDIGNYLVATGDNPNANDVTWIALANIIGTIPGNTSVSGKIIKPGTPITDLELRTQSVGEAREGTLRTIYEVPEPGTLVLLGLASLGLVVYRRRRG